jgi:polyisoprenoid-binding protein YceI
MIGSNVKASLALLVIGGFVVGAAVADVPPRSAGGQTLAVPARQLELGDVYHVTPGAGTQLTWTSDAPLTHIVATCNRVVGYFVAPFDMEGETPPLLAGAIRIPVASLRSGIGELDGQFHSEPALNVAEYPEMTLEITGITDSNLVTEDGGKLSYTFTAACRLTVKDKTLELDLPMRMTLMPFTWQTMQLGMGDTLILRTEFDIARADLPMATPPQADADFVPESSHVELFLLCNTMSPERNLHPEITHDVHHKQLQFVTLLRDFRDAEKGYEFGRSFMKEIWDDAQALNRLAQAALGEDLLETRDLAFALKAAQRANDLTESKDAELLSTLALVYHEKGELESAIKWARQAVENLGDAAPPLAEQVRQALERYESQAKRLSEQQ